MAYEFRTVWHLALIMLHVEAVEISPMFFLHLFGEELCWKLLFCAAKIQVMVPIAWHQGPREDFESLQDLFAISHFNFLYLGKGIKLQNFLKCFIKQKKTRNTQICLG